FSDHLNAAREIHFSLRELRVWLTRWTTKQFSKRTIRHAQALRVTEILMIHFQTAIVANVDEVVFDQLDIFRFTVWSKAHHLVLTTVNFKTRVVGESAVQQTQAVWEAKFV